MAAQNTDNFILVSQNTGWQVGAAGVADSSVTTVPLVSATGLPTTTAVLITIDRVDSSGTKIPAKMERVIGVVSGNNIIDCVRGVEGTAQAHAGGAVVEIVISAGNINKLMTAILVGHNQNGTHILDTDGTLAANSDTKIPSQKAVKTYADAIKTYLLCAPEGTMYNGKIVPSVASGNLTVALKTMAGNDPSVSDPIYVRIGDTVRSITSALSRTWNAGSGYLNLGSAELATKETDLFTKFVWNTNLSAVDLIVSRIPFGDLISEYTDSLTAEKGYLYAGTKPASTDVVVNVGRFAATLSAGAGYTWSVPTFTASNLIQRPIYKSRPSLAIVPTLTSAGGTITGATITKDCTYQIRGSKVSFKGRITLTGVGSGSPTGALKLVSPFTSKQDYYEVGSSMETSATGFYGSAVVASTVTELKKYENGTWFVNGYRVGFAIEYEI